MEHQRGNADVQIARPNSQDKFWFYNSAIGDLTRFIHRHSVAGLKSTPGFITNCFGVKINPAFLPEVLAGREGVEPPPIPANWHTDVAELGSALRAVELAKKSFTVVELGCGWACWLNIAGAVARRQNLECKLIGVEGDEGHVRFAHASLTENGFSTESFKIYHGVAAAKPGVALFPRQDVPGVGWGSEPVFHVTDELSKQLLATGRYIQLNQIALEDVTYERQIEKIDLLHMDIQGGEEMLVRESLGFLSERVAYMLIGTHSRQIEGVLIKCLQEAGWVLEVERPAVLAVGRSTVTEVDGVQAWRNPRILSDEEIGYVGTEGWIRVRDCPERVAAREYFEVRVDLGNESTTDWCSSCSMPVRISYHWVSRDGQIVVFDGERTNIDGNFLYAGGRVVQDLKVLAPGDGGDYLLRVTLVQEGVKWFDSFGLRFDQSVQVDQ